MLASLPITTPWQHPDSYSALHLYVIRINPAQTSQSRLEIFEKLRKQGIGVNVHYIPVHTQPYYRNLGFKSGDFPQAENYYTEAISFPMFHTMTEAQQDSVVEALRKAVEI
jgi:dTDP-4-amino-4,6-dideoxygalactose transaminase